MAQCLGANLVIGDYDGTATVPEFRNLQRGTDVGPYDDDNRKFQADGAVVNITRPNPPCSPAGKLIESVYGEDVDALPRAKEFVSAAQGRRGFVGMIVKGGEMAVSQAIRFVSLGE